MIALFLAPGFEEIEALGVVDVLRRAELNVTTIGVGGRAVKSARGIVVQADVADADALTDGLEAVVLPGGMPGTLNLEASPVAGRFLEAAVERGLLIAAICAAPSILGHRGLLEGRRAICFPGYEQELKGAEIVREKVVSDGPFITGRGAGVAVDFALEIVRRMASAERADRVRAAMQC